MEVGEKIKKGEIGSPEYVNKNCWLAKTLNYPPAERCQYCELKFRDCQFFHYLITSLILILFLLALSLLIERRISELLIVSIFVLVIIYGRFFSKSTERLIKANFSQKKAKDALEELTDNLQQKVDEQTKDIKQAYEKLKKLDKAKSEFISIASHQLRTPLTTIKGYISMILEGSYGSLQEKTKESLTKVYQANERLIKLANDLLNISRLESGKIELQKEKISLESLIANVIEMLKIQAQDKNLYLKLEKPENPMPQLNIDEGKISQAISNIIDNAIRYTEKGGITIKIAEERKEENEDKVTIEVKDTGLGMEKKDIKDLFESFSRGQAGAKHWTEGVGLGLYIAQKFVNLHQGKIWAESEGKNKGMTFHIELPIKQN